MFKSTKSMPLKKRLLHIIVAFVIILTALAPIQTFAAADGAAAAGGAAVVTGASSARPIVLPCEHTNGYMVGGVSCCLPKSTIYVWHKDAYTGAVLSSECYLKCCGYYGPYYAKSFYGYGAGYLSPYSAPICGYICKCQTINIIYLYVKVPVTATIIVQHVDQDTRAVMKSNTYTVYAGSYGPYYPESFPGYGPGYIVPGSAPASGTIEGGQTKTIQFMYRKLPVNAYITVTHRDKDTWAPLKVDTYTVVAGNYGPYSALSFPGYGPGVLAQSSAPASGYVAASASINIIYEYAKLPVKATVTVAHKDRDTGAILRSDTYTIDPGYYGPYNPLNFPDYGPGTLASDSAPAYGTIEAGKSLTITYVYVKKQLTATINVVHKDTDTGAVLQSYTHTVNAGDYGPYNAISIPGYRTGTLENGSAPPSGTISAGATITISYVYKRIAVNATIYVVHKDIDTGAVLQSYTHTVDEGNYGPFGAISISGYGAGTLANGSASASGYIYAGTSITISYVYARLTATINVLHKDSSTGAVLESYVHTVYQGNYGPYNAIVINGYGAGTLMTGSAPASGYAYGGTIINITYLYVKNATTGTINVIHKDSATGNTLQSFTYTVNLGYYGPYEAISITGYGAGKLAADSDSASGYISAGQTKNIIYVYTKRIPNSANVAVLHVSTDGAMLSSNVYTVDEGDYGPYNAQAFSGFDYNGLDQTSAPACGSIRCGETKIVTHKYRRR